jgi:hypothetical protein
VIESSRGGGRSTNIYRCERAQIEERIAETYDRVLAQTRLNADEFAWTDGIGNAEEPGQIRMAAMQTFLNDFEPGKCEGRYVDADLPTLFRRASFLFSHSGVTDRLLWTTAFASSKKPANK